MSIQPDVRSALATGDPSALPGLAQLLKDGTGALGLAIYDAHGELLAAQRSAGRDGGAGQRRCGEIAAARRRSRRIRARRGLAMAGRGVSHPQRKSIGRRHGDCGGRQLHPRRRHGSLAAELLAHCCVCDSDCRHHAADGALVPPSAHEARGGAPAPACAPAIAEDSAEPDLKELRLFSPLAREVETMAESLIAARAAAAAEARLREAGENLWTAERLAVHMRNRAGSSKIFVVSNREPYMHVRQGREIVCVVPPSGLVTALEPVLRACDGVWVASGSGDADASNGRRVRPACACLPTIRATLCAGCGCQRKKKRNTTTASPMRGCGRSAISRIRGPSFARRTGSAISASTRGLPTRCLKRWRTAQIPWSLCRTITSPCCRS